MNQEFIDNLSIVPDLDRLQKLEQKVKEILLQAGDDPCWMDWGRLYPELAKLCNIKDYKPRLLPKEEMLRNCSHFVESLSTDKEYISEKRQLTMDLFNRINEAHNKVADKLNWDLWIDPNDPEWRLALAEAIDEILNSQNDS